VAASALRSLRRQPIATWESLEGYAVLQSSVAAASARGDIGTVRAITGALGRFLTQVRDPGAEAANVYDRKRYRALKDLLSGCGQHAAEAPHAVTYNIGYLQAGVLLQAVAVGHPMADGEHDLFTGLLGVLRNAPERLNVVWTGLRHALCRRAGDGRDPYLVQFWLEHPGWTATDPRWYAHIATGLAGFHAGCRRRLRDVWGQARADAEAADMLVDLYRDLSTHLGKQVAQERRRIKGMPLLGLTLQLLDAVHAAVMQSWPSESEAQGQRAAVVAAYDQRRAELVAL
jgi:hypothetical protein